MDCPGMFRSTSHACKPEWLRITSLQLLCDHDLLSVAYCLSRPSLSSLVAAGYGPSGRYGRGHSEAQGVCQGSYSRRVICNEGSCTHSCGNILHGPPMPRPACENTASNGQRCVVTPYKYILRLPASTALPIGMAGRACPVKKATAGREKVGEGGWGGVQPGR